MNRCPCGYNGGPVKECKCSATEISRYQKRISGSFLDHIDIFVDLSKYPDMNMKHDLFAIDIWASGYYNRLNYERDEIQALAKMVFVEANC